MNFYQPCKYAQFNDNSGETRDGIGVGRTQVFFSARNMEHFCFHLFHCRPGYGNIWLLKYPFCTSTPTWALWNPLQGAFYTLKCFIGSQWHQQPVQQHWLLKGILRNLGTCSGFKFLPFLTARNQHLPLYDALHGWILPHENLGSILATLLFITSKSLPKYSILLFLLRLVFIVCRSCC